jgi:hypothetical protein
MKSIMGWAEDGMLANYGSGDRIIELKREALKKALK